MDQYPAYCNMILNSQVDLMLEALETDKPYPIRMGKLGFGAPNKCLICNVEPVSESYDTDMNLIWEKFGKLV